MTQALAYAGFPDIDSVRPKTEADDPLFKKLAAVLAEEGALNRFGVTLLHTHFPIREGETLLETTDRDAREQLIRPVPVSDLDDQKHLETSWRLGPQGEVRLACQCLMTPDGSQHQGHFPTG